MNCLKVPIADTGWLWFHTTARPWGLNERPSPAQIIGIILAFSLPAAAAVDIRMWTALETCKISLKTLKLEELESFTVS